MKVVFVVDTIDELNKKVNILQNKFGDNVLFIVKANLSPLFNTFGYTASGVYNKNLARVIHFTLARLNIEDTVICYASVELSDGLLNSFISHIGEGTKIVNVMPNYNAFEQFGNGCYNIYCKSVFKAHDSLASPKLQYLPKAALEELLVSHISNRLFETAESCTTNIFVQDAKVNKTLKVKTPFNKYVILPIIFALVITATLIMSLAFWGVGYLVIFVHVALYVLDIILGVIFQCKNYFDTRFLK